MKKRIFVITLITILSLGYIIYITEFNELEKREAISKVLNLVAEKNKIPAYDLNIVSLKDKFLSRKYVIELNYVKEDKEITISIDDQTGKINKIDSTLTDEDINKASNTQNVVTSNSQINYGELIEITGVDFNSQYLEIKGNIYEVEKKVNYQVYNYIGEILYGDEVTYAKGLEGNYEFKIRLEDEFKDISLVEFFTIESKKNNKVCLERFYIESFGKGRVVDVLENEILVEGIFKNSNKKRCMFYFEVEKDTLIYNYDSSKLIVEDLKEGDWIKVWIDFPYEVQGTKPPKSSVKIIERTYN